MPRTSRKRTLDTKRKLALLVSAAAVAGGGAFALAATSNAVPAGQTQSSAVCEGLATALGNNEKFIEGQRANPDAQSEARIANREAVIAEIERKQETSGCTPGESAQDTPAEQPASAPADTSGEATGGAPAVRAGSRSARGVSPGL